MRLGFLLPRTPMLKNLGGLVAACLSGGHEALVFYLEENAMDAGPKAYQKELSQIQAQFAPQQPRVFPYQPSGIAHLAHQHRLDALIMEEGYHVLNNAGTLEKLDELRRNGTAVFSLTHFFETSRLPLEALDHFDQTYFMSDFGIELLFELNAATPAQRTRYRPRMVAVGSPTFDQLADIHRPAARAELNLPADRPVVVFPAPVLSPVTTWRWVVWREAALRTRLKRAFTARRLHYLPDILSGPPFEHCVAAVREFCDRHNALLVVKSRLKQDDPSYLVDAADLYLEGSHEEYYPVFTVYKLLAAADLVISAQSMSLVEAVAAGVPAINIHMPYHEIAETDSPIYRRYLDILLGSAPNSLMNTPGCLWSHSWRTFPRWLAGKNLADFSLQPEAARAYQRGYLGMEDVPSSQRVLNAILAYLEAKQTA